MAAAPDGTLIYVNYYDKNTMKLLKQEIFTLGLDLSYELHIQQDIIIDNIKYSNWVTSDSTKLSSMHFADFTKNYCNDNGEYLITNIYATQSYNIQAYLNYEGLKTLWNLISMDDYPNNDMLIAVLNAVDETKADKEDIPSLKEYYDEENQVLTLLHNKEITFYIDEDEYKCEEGMLWTELINGTNTYYSIPVLFFNNSVYPFEYNGRNFDPAGNGPVNMQSYTTVYGGSPEK